MNLNFSPEENELLLTHTAAVRTGDKPAVILVGSQHQQVLCHCDDLKSASLIKKLFNLGLKIPNPEL